MPRQARIDAPGALHHVIVRGIARRRVFNDDADRDFFVERLGRILIDSETPFEPAAGQVGCGYKSVGQKPV